MTQKTSSSFTVCHNFALEINYFPVLLSVRALLARLPKRNKRKVVSGSRVTHQKILLVNPGYLLTLLLGLPCPGSRVTLPACKQGLNRVFLVLTEQTVLAPTRSVPSMKE